MRKDTWTTFEIADHCQVTHRTVQGWITLGKIKSFRTPGGHSRVSADDLIKFLKDHQIPLPDSLEHLARLKKRILIVDDDRITVALMKVMINPDDRYELDVAYDGFAAGKRFAEFKPDLVTLDIGIPKLDGISVCREIRADARNAHVKVLIVSGVEPGLEDAELKAMGADGYMAKPVTKNGLVKEVERLLC